MNGEKITTLTKSQQEYAIISETQCTKENDLFQQLTSLDEQKRISQSIHPDSQFFSHDIRNCITSPPMHLSGQDASVCKSSNSVETKTCNQAYSSSRLSCQNKKGETYLKMVKTCSREVTLEPPRLINHFEHYLVASISSSTIFSVLCTVFDHDRYMQAPLQSIIHK